MHDIWNPWHGCIKVSEGCAHCYMYYLDRLRGNAERDIYKTQAFGYPVQRRRGGGYKIRSGEQIRVCMTSDFFLEEADIWRDDAWRMMKERSDVRFFLLTKRPERVEMCLPSDWGDGWENIFFNVTCENQHRADERIPILLRLPFKHKGIMTAPLIGPIEIDNFLSSGQIEQVIAGGENYDGARPCNFDWVKSLSDQCLRHDISFYFIETGTVFVKDGKTYHIPNKRLQFEMAFKAQVNHIGKPMVFHLTDPLGFEIEKEFLHKPYFKSSCEKCGSKCICNGCSKCGKCNF